MSSVIGYATLQIVPSLDGLEKAVNAQMGAAVAPAENVGTRMGASMATSAGNSFGKSFLTIAGGILGASGIQSIFSGIRDAIGTGLSMASFQQSAQKSLTTLTGSAKTAQKTLGDLSKFAASTPFDLQGATSAAQKLLGAGASAKDIIPTLTALGDATAAVGGSQDSLNATELAWSQIMTRGKLDTQDLYQVANAGIPIWKELAKALNVPVGSIQDLVSTGSVLADDALPKLQAQLEKDYGGSMAGQAKTLAGVWSTVKDTISTALGTAFRPLAPILANVLPPAANALAGAITAVSKAFEGLLTWGKQNMAWIQPLAFAVGGAAAAFGIYQAAIAATKIPMLLATAAQWAWNVALDANPLGLIVLAIGAVVGGIVWFVTQTKAGQAAFQAVSAALVAAFNWVKDTAIAVWNWIVSTVSGAINWMIGYTQTLVTGWTTAWNALSGFVSGIWNAITGFIVNGAHTAVNFVLGVAKSIQSAFSGAFNWLAGIARDMWNGFVSTWNKVVSGIADIVLAPFRGAIAAVKALLGIHSPSRVMGEIAGNVADGFINELDRRSGDIQDAYGVFGAQAVYGPAAPALGGPGIAASIATNGPVQLTQVHADEADVLNIMRQIARGEVLIAARQSSQRYGAGHL
jgi:tape measure domain-containing protein